MPLSSLPQTYTDAIFIARKLSIPFLWIDSLCIIQDDDDDRNFELGRMDKTFRNASLVLVAASANDPYQGFLEPRRSKLLWSAPTTIRLEVGQGQLVVSRSSEHEHRADACSDHLIRWRAWALQERLLAQRCLIFTEFECVWECRAGCKCECERPSRFGGLKTQLLKFGDTIPVESSTLISGFWSSEDQVAAPSSGGFASVKKSCS